MKYLNEEKLDRLIGKVQKSIAYGGILPSKHDEIDDNFALHEALMILQFLVKHDFVKFNDNGFSLNTADNKRQKNEN